MIIATGDEWFPAEPTGRYVRLNFAGPDPGAFATAARLVAEALEEQPPAGAASVTTPGAGTS